MTYTTYYDQDPAKSSVYRSVLNTDPLFNQWNSQLSKGDLTGFTQFKIPTQQSGYDNKDKMINNALKYGFLSEGQDRIGPDGAFNNLYNSTVIVPNKYASQIAQDFKPIDTNPEKKKSGFGLGSLLGLASFAFPALAPWAAGVNVAEGVSNGNIGQALGGVMGLPGVGNSITGSLGKVVSSAGVPAAATPYVTKGLLSAGITGLSGGNLQQSITNGLASGAGSYAGNQVSNSIGTQFSPAVTRGLSQATAGLLGSAIKGGNVGMGGLLSGINGFSQGAGYGGAGQALTQYIKQQQQRKALQQRAQRVA